MLSEIAIADEKAFTNLVTIAKDALNGKTTKKVEKVETKKEEKKETKKVAEETTDYSKMTVAELKKIATEKKVEGSSTMKKAELVEALTNLK